VRIVLERGIVVADGGACGPVDIGEVANAPGDWPMLPLSINAAVRTLPVAGNALELADELRQLHERSGRRTA
jgi:hypothetical protein